METVVQVSIESVEVVGCGHTIYMSAEHQRELRRSHKSFWCTICGRTNWYPDKSDLERLRGELASAKDMLESTRRDRDLKEAQRRAEKGAKTKLKKRVSNGVCPCCTRSFCNLQRHMATQHPDYMASD